MGRTYKPWKIRSGYHIERAQTPQALAHSIITYVQKEGCIIYEVEPWRAHQLQHHQYVYRLARSMAADFIEADDKLPPLPPAVSDPLLGLQTIVEWAKPPVEATNVEESGGVEMCKNAVTLKVAVSQFKVSRATLMRAIENGILKSYRPKDHSESAPHMVDAVEIARRWPRRK